MRFPIPTPTFASVDGYLAYQRQCVGDARLVVHELADQAWMELSEAGCAAFAASLPDLVAEAGTLPVWRRAWWIHAIGGRPRAPFELATTPELAARLVDALAPTAPPSTLAAELADWWEALIRAAREYIADHVALRVAGAAERLATEGMADETPERSHMRGNRRRRPYGQAERDRVRKAANEMVATHQSLNRHFAALGPVCAACTRETGGCCTLTVPLIWREADYRLMALGGVQVPSPVAETAGACPFLGKMGCRLPSERRPHICRSFLCERAEQALGDGIDTVRDELNRLNMARSRIG